MEVKTYILRRLPVLIYNSQASNIADGTQDDPTITSLYFDSPKFSLYTANVNRSPKASSLRLRWYGSLQNNPEIFLERKSLVEGGDREETRISIKEKYVQSFIEGKYKMEKSVRKLQEQQGQTVVDTERYRQTVQEMQQFIMKNNLRPMLRATYTRTAFQIPGNGRIRVSLDTNLVFAQEDETHREKGSWHRTELDQAASEDAMVGDIGQPQKSEFPFALLEIRVRKSNRRRMPEWASDLVSSHLVHETPRFSKFMHGVAVLFEEQVNSLPFWISDLDQDIRKDPAATFEEEKDKAAIEAHDELAVGSFLSVERGGHLRKRRHGNGQSYTAGTRRLGRAHDLSARLRRESKETLLAQAKHDVSADDERSDSRGIIDGGSDDERGSGEQEEGEQEGEDALRSDRDIGRRLTTTAGDDGRMWKKKVGRAFLVPRFTLAQGRRRYGTITQPNKRQGDDDNLPVGVRHPGLLLKDSGPVKVEAKVWLANERTFVRWQHCSVLLGSLALALFNAVPDKDWVGRSLAMVYMALACFAGLWGWAMYLRRSHLIGRRSGRDFDNVLGPIIVCLGLIFALSLNLSVQVSRR